MNVAALSRAAAALIAMTMTVLALAQTVIDLSSPDTIVEVQTLLGEYGFDPGSVDGIMGSKTANAIRQYQAAAGLEQDGVISEALVLSLRTGAEAPPLLSEQELLDVVARIALYPDDLLAIVLPATTFPLQIVRAARFLEDHKKDPSLKPNEGWDTSVLGLLNYPEVITMMNEDLEWTETLGNAVVDQPEELMEAIQQFRSQAYEAGNLKTDDKQTVTQETVEERETIVIESTDPEVIYVPRYDPAVVVVDNYVGTPVYYSSAYPVYYSPAATFFTGLFVGAAVSYGFNWGRRDITYKRTANINVNTRPRGGSAWRPTHRPGRPGYRPGSRPGARPGRPVRPRAKQPIARRPAARPAKATRPAAKPARSAARNPTGGYKSGRKARVDSRRGGQSRSASAARVQSKPRTSRPASQRPGASSRGAFGGVSNGRSARRHSSRGGRSRGGGRRGSGRRR